MSKKLEQPIPEKLPIPKFKRVIVKPQPMPEKTEGGIIIPGSTNTLMERADVIKSDSDVIKEGDVAIYPMHLGVDLVRAGIKYKWLNDSEIWGVDEE